MLETITKKNILFSHFAILAINIFLIHHSADMNKKINLCSKGGVIVSPETEKIIATYIKDFYRNQQQQYRKYLEHQAGGSLR